MTCTRRVHQHPTRVLARTASSQATLTMATSLRAFSGHYSLLRRCFVKKHGTQQTIVLPALGTLPSLLPASLARWQTTSTNSVAAGGTLPPGTTTEPPPIPPPDSSDSQSNVERGPRISSRIFDFIVDHPALFFAALFGPLIAYIVYGIRDNTAREAAIAEVDAAVPISAREIAGLGRSNRMKLGAFRGVVDDAFANMAATGRGSIPEMMLLLRRHTGAERTLSTSISGGAERSSSTISGGAERSSSTTSGGGVVVNGHHLVRALHSLAADGKHGQFQPGVNVSSSSSAAAASIGSVGHGDDAATTNVSAASMLTRDAVTLIEGSTSLRTIDALSLEDVGAGAGSDSPQPTPSAAALAAFLRGQPTVDLLALLGMAGTVLGGRPEIAVAADAASALALAAPPAATAAMSSAPATAVPSADAADTASVPSVPALDSPLSSAAPPSLPTAAAAAAAPSALPTNSADGDEIKGVTPSQRLELYLSMTRRYLAQHGSGPYGEKIVSPRPLYAASTTTAADASAATTPPASIAKDSYSEAEALTLIELLADTWQIPSRSRVHRVRDYPLPIYGRRAPADHLHKALLDSKMISEADAQALRPPRSYTFDELSHLFLRTKGICAWGECYATDGVQADAAAAAAAGGMQHAPPGATTMR